MQNDMHTTVFEFGFLTSDKAAAREQGAVLITDAAFSYLKDVCLSGEVGEIVKCLRLTKRGGIELLQVLNYVGVIMTPNGEHIEVLPKLGRNMGAQQSQQLLLHMLRYLGDFRFITTAQASVASQKMPLLEVFIQQFLHSVNHLLKRGLKSDYLSQTDNLAFRKGKLLVAKQLRHNLVHRHRFFVEYDEYQINRPANRLLKTALVKVMSFTRSAANQKLLRELLFAFDEVPVCQSVKQDVSALKCDRSMRDYQTPLAWAKLILQGLSPLSMKGDAQAMSLLLPMETVFENYVAAVLRAQLADEMSLTTQARSHYLVSHNKANHFLLKPDLLITDANQQCVVLDTKWKLLDLSAPNYGISQSDLYQMLAYGYKYLSGKGELVLIYPAHDDFCEAIKECFDFGNGLRLWVIPFEICTAGNANKSGLRMAQEHELSQTIVN